MKVIKNRPSKFCLASRVEEKLSCAKLTVFFSGYIFNEVATDIYDGLQIQ